MQFKQYPSYKNSGVEWLGDVPEHWESNRLKKYLIERNEKNSPIKTDNLLSVTMYQGVIPVSEKQGNGGNKPKENLENYKISYPNDIVLNSMNVIVGSVGLNKYTGLISPAYYALYNRNKNNNIKFFSYIFHNPFFQKGLFGLGNGIMYKESEDGKLNTIRLKIPMEKLNQVVLPCPSISEQNQIVAFLDTETARIDNLISKQEKLIELLEEQRKSIISHAVTKGLNPNAPMKDSGVEWLGEVPEHWNLKPIKFLAKTNQLTLAENTDENYEIQYVDIGSVSRTNGIEKIETILFKDAPSRARRIVKDGDIIVSTVRTYLKAIAYIENPPKNLIVSTGFAVLNPIRTVIFPQYAKFTFLAEQFIAEVIAKSKGISYPAITATELADIKIALPPLNEQKVILQYLLEENLKMNKLISKQNQLIEKLKEYRASIISHAVTGKIDVREFGA